MKFGKKLRFECVSEWTNKYIAYGKLKKYLRYLYKNEFESLGHAEEQHLLINGFPSINSTSDLISTTTNNNSNNNNSINVINTDINNNNNNNNNSNNNNNNNNNNNTTTPPPSQQLKDKEPKSPTLENKIIREEDEDSDYSDEKSNTSNEKTPLMSTIEFDDSNNNKKKRSGSSSLSTQKSFSPSSSFDLHKHPLTQADRERLFISKIDEELKKINEFFLIKEKDIILHYNKLTEHCSIILKDRNPSPKVLKNIQKAFAELYKSLTMLENFVTLNYQGFEKILKKYDRLAPSDASIKSNQMARISDEVFYSSKSWRNMKEDVELLYCKVFKIDRISIAKKKLSPFSESQTLNIHMLKLGFAIGLSVSIIAFIIILFTNQDVGEPDWTKFSSTIPIFRAVGLPILAVWLYGANVFIWDRARVNYILIFGLDPRTTLDYRRIWKTASFLTSIWLMTFLLFCGTIKGNFTLGSIPAQVYPLVLVVFFLGVAFFPFRFFHRKSRLLLFITLGNVIITPFGSTKFRALFLGDVLTSMVKTIFDWEYTACYFFSGDWLINDGARCNEVNSIALPILSGLPLLWRFMQCILRYNETKNRIHIGNSTKYAVGFSVVLFSALNGNYQSYEPWSAKRILWCVCFVLSTLYMYCWDVVVDWGFLWGGKPRPLLRHQLMYKKHLWCYYYVIFSNLVLRFAWTLTITKIPFELPINSELFTSIITSVELIRRFTWSIFRVENEHICNSIQYHAFDFSEAPWKNEVPKLNLNNSLLPISRSPYDYNNNNVVGSSSAVSTNSPSGSNNFNSTNSYDNQYSIWKKSSKQYYSNSILDQLKKKFFNNKK